MANLDHVHEQRQNSVPVRTLLPWGLLALGLFLVAYNKITGDHVFPVFQIENLSAWAVWQVPFVYVFSYITRAWSTLLFAFMVGGMLISVVPREKIKQYTASNNFTSYVAAAAFAPLLTVCSCAMIPIFGGLIMAGAGVGPAVSFLLMAPAANFLAIITTFDIISGEMALARVVASFIGAIAIGMAISRTRAARDLEKRLGDMRPAARMDPEGVQQLSFAEKSWNALGEAWGLARSVLPYLAAGLVVVSFVEAYFPPQLVSAYLTGTSGILLASVIGVPTYTPTLVEVFLINTMMGLGMSPGAALAFLIGAPMVSLPSMMAVARIAGWRVVLRYAVLAVVVAFLAGSVYQHLVAAL